MTAYRRVGGFNFGYSNKKKVLSLVFGFEECFVWFLGLKSAVLCLRPPDGSTLTALGLNLHDELGLQSLVQKAIDGVLVKAEGLSQLFSRHRLRTQSLDDVRHHQTSGLTPALCARGELDDQ